MKAVDRKDLFENTKVSSAIFKLAFPTVVGQIILVIYNMADTFFVGLSNNDVMLAAVTVSMPAFMFLSAISNLFGIGGASVIARALGAGDDHRAKCASSFAFWGCLATAALYSLFTLFARDGFIDLLGGTNAQVHKKAVEYLLLTVGTGGIFTSTGMLFSHLLRAEGRSMHASAGIILGGVLNIGLDPLFMFVLLPPGKEALGAAIATTLSNVLTLLYFAAVLLSIRNKTVLRFALKPRIIKDNVPYAVICAGLPACIMTLFENVSYAALDKLMSLAGLAMQAGIGVSKKVNMLAHCIVRGIAQGSLPLIAYNYSAHNFDRMKSSVRMAHAVSVTVASVCMIMNLLFAKPLIGLFIHQASESLIYGVIFLRILCLGGPFSASAYTIISFFQATGEGLKSFLLAILRKGIVDIPLMFLLNTVIPVYGIVMATPIADALCCAAANILFFKYSKRLQSMNASFGTETPEASD